MSKSIFWNGTGLNLLSETERKLVEHNDVCRAGVVTVVGDQLWLDSKHVIGTIADPDEEGPAPLAERVRLAEGGAPRQMTMAEMAKQLKDLQLAKEQAEARADRAFAQRDDAMARAMAKAVTPGPTGFPIGPMDPPKV